MTTGLGGMLGQLCVLSGILAAVEGCGALASSSRGGSQAGTVAGDVGGGDASDGADGLESTPHEGGLNAAPTPTVHGMVVDRYQRPVATYRVTIGDQSALSAADGTFTIPGVSATYDAVITSADGGPTCVYAGLTRRDPRLAVPFAASNSFNARASVMGALPAGSNNQGILAYFVPAPPGPVQLVDTSIASGTSYAVDVAWDSTSSPTLSGTLHVLEFDGTTPDGSFATASNFTGYGSFGITLMPNDSATMPAAAFGSLRSGTVSAMVPSGARRLSALMKTPDGSARFYVSGYESPGPGMESLAVPLVQGATFFLSLTGVGPGGATEVVRRVVVPGTMVDLTLPPEPIPATPPDMATADDTTTFTWSAAGTGIFDFFVQPVTFEGVVGSGCCQRAPQGVVADVYEVITTSPKATLARLTANMTLPSQQQYYWGVRGYADRASVDDATGTQSIDWECDESSKAPDGEAECATAGYPTFVAR
jgi:hypothetical protein